MEETTVQLATPDGPMEAFRCFPEEVPAAGGLVVLQGAFGVNPHLCCFGDKDASISPEEVEEVRRRLAARGPQHEVAVYPGAGHGFFCDERPSFHRQAAADAWKRMLAWFDRTVRTA